MVKISRRGKTATVFKGAWGQSQGIMVGPSSEGKRSQSDRTRPSTSRKWDVQRSTTGQGNPRKGKKGKHYTGGGF